MKKTINPVLAMALATIFSLSAKAQNLVPNPSFEDFDTCPNFGQIQYAVGWSSYSYTPDYYNACAPETTHCSVPSNYAGFHYARTGSAYAALVTFTSTVTNAREFIGIQLVQPLIIGNKYYVSFYACKSSVDLYSIATNNLGVRLSSIPYSQNNPKSVDNYAQVYTDSIITDTLNWIKVSGNFIADSSYKYLIIGNFFNDSLTSIVKSDIPSTYAYYVIDDVYLSDIPDSYENFTPTDSGFFVKGIADPAQDWIEFEGRRSCRFSLYDIHGKICITGESASFSLVNINICQFIDGMYFLNIQDYQENITRKIIISKK